MRREFVWALMLMSILPAALYATDKEIALPKPGIHKDVSIEEAFDRSRTERTFSEKPLTLAETSAVLWAAAGKRYDAVTEATRTYPSAHAYYPIAFYVVVGAVKGMEPGIYRYVWNDHSLKLMKS